MKNFTSLLLFSLMYAACNASPTPDTPDLSERVPAKEPNWFTVTEYASTTFECEGPHTAQQSSPYVDHSLRSGCRDVKSNTTRLRWESDFTAQGMPSAYLLTFSKPGCMGPIKMNITKGRDCLGKKDFYGEVFSYESWRTSYQ